MRILIGFLLLCTAITLPVFPQEGNNPTEPRIVSCRTMDEITAAREGGADIIEANGRYFVVNGDEYEGPWMERANAIEFWRGLQPERSTILTETDDDGETRVYNPELMLFPFTTIDPQQGLLFEVAGEAIVPASHVMVHAEPFLFREVSFAPIVLGVPRELRRAQQGQPRPMGGRGVMPPGGYGGGMGMGMGMMPPPQRTRPTPIPPDKHFFAVTGAIQPKETIQWPEDNTDLWVGAAVVGQDGVVLWKTYGRVEEDGDFACVANLPTTRVSPRFLLYFVLGKAKLETNLRPDDDIPVIPAEAYDYHVLASGALEVAANWYPPMEEAFQEELELLLQEKQQEQSQAPSSGD